MQTDAGWPRLIVVSGAPGAGKTTLAHALAEALLCPAICRDQIKDGLVLGSTDRSPAADEEATARANEAFFTASELLIGAGVTVVIEAAFQHRLWVAGLASLIQRATVRVIRCSADAALARERIERRLEADRSRREAHADAALLDRLDRGDVSLDAWAPLVLPGVPTLVVDTSDKYVPSLEAVVAFARG